MRHWEVERIDEALLLLTFHRSRLFLSKVARRTFLLQPPPLPKQPPRRHLRGVVHHHELCLLKDHHLLVQDATTMLKYPNPNATVAENLSNCWVNVSQLMVVELALKAA